MVDVKDILRKHSAKIESQMNGFNSSSSSYGGAYTKFKAEMAPEYSRYERWAHSLGSLVKLKVAEKDEGKVKRAIEIAHLDVEPWQALGLSAMSFITIFIFGILSSVAFYLVGFANIGSLAVYFFLMLLLGMFVFYFMNEYPKRLANKWRLKASSQMVPALLYVVVYMRHTSNLEKAIAFAAEHLQEPLSLDFKKVFYNVQMGKFSTIKESLDNYLETWRDYSPEFIEAFHLIESSLFEPENARRITILEKSLQVVLDGVYDNMLKFTHNVKSPLTNVYMLGVVLPTLALALLPLASSMVGDYLKWTYIFVLFNLIVPFLVFYLTDKIMILRPGGHGESTLLERNSLYPQYKSKSHYYKAFLIVLPLLILGLMPLIFHYTPLPDLLHMPSDPMLGEVLPFLDSSEGAFGSQKIFDYREVNGKTKGPFGMGAVLLSMFIPLGLALFFSLAYKNKTKHLILERNKIKRLEKEFNNSLFQLGNRLGSGLPPELVFGKVAESSKGLMTEEFFSKVNYNIRRGGMSIQRAIFDKRQGAINYYPSDLIATSMRILIEASKKGLQVAAISLMSISQYVKNINKITSRLKDILADILSDMKSNMTFLAPLLSGIVVGLTVMITAILGKLEMSDIIEGGSDQFGVLLETFKLTNMAPPYFLQIIIGIYLIQIIFILTATLVGVDAGEDRLEKTYRTGQNLMKGMMLYLIVAFASTLVLAGLVFSVLGNI
jgi:hypothetical protein